MVTRVYHAPAAACASPLGTAADPLASAGDPPIQTLQPSLAFNQEKQDEMPSQNPYRGDSIAALPRLRGGLQ
jgi:hypothetical protein